MSEHVAQAQLVARCRHLRQGLLLFAIPNGGVRDKRTAVRLRAEGVLAGVPDLLLAESRMGYHGMFIEMKAEDQRRPSSVRPIQRRVHEMLRRRGYRVVVAYGVEEGWRAVCEYLDGEEDPLS
ncbi:MAG: VRR-NUC domain-containing protein [Candidatus Rokubacteria bacterium]|nr:VRR-NUC domain-containing protein [Candidatus Rokubacteria bacterium]